LTGESPSCWSLIRLGIHGNITNYCTVTKTKHFITYNSSSID
jgi:hypothetical protein